MLAPCHLWKRRKRKASAGSSIKVDTVPMEQTVNGTTGVKCVGYPTMGNIIVEGEREGTETGRPNLGLLQARNR